jgi:acyl dehydratase
MSMRGLVYEEFELEKSFTTPGRTVTETDVVQFAALSGDYTSLHTDEVFARTSPHGQRIAHGMLGVAIASGLAFRTGIFEGTVLALKSQTIQYVSPIFLGDTVHLRLTVKEKSKRNPRSPRGTVKLQADLVNQNDKVVSTGFWECVMLSRPEPARS